MEEWALAMLVEMRAARIFLRSELEGRVVCKLQVKG